MLIMPLICAALETSLNALFIKEPLSQPVLRRLSNKALQIKLQEFPEPVTLLFFAQRIDVVSEWEQVDCRLTARFAVLPDLRDRQQFARLLQTGDLILEGDLQVAQMLMALLDTMEWDIAEWFSPYIGDLAAETLQRCWHQGSSLIRHRWQADQRYLAEILIEEWRLVPGGLEVTHFNDQVADLLCLVEALDNRLARLESSE